MEESIEQCIKDLLTVACCPGHDYSCKKVYKYVKELQKRNKKAVKYIKKELIPYGDEWHWDDSSIRDYVEEVLHILEKVK